MKTNSKKTIFVVSLAVVMMVNISFLPSVIRAENANGKNQGFCNNIDNFSTKIIERLTEKDTKLLQKKTEREDQIAARRAERDSKLADHRLKWDTNRIEHYVKLEERATTDAQKQALLTFELIIDSTISARKTAVNQAISDFRAGIDQLIVNRKSSVATTVSNYKNLVNTAIENAKSGCIAGTDSKTVREKFAADSKTAREKLRSDIQAVEKVGEQVKFLTTAKNAAIRNALDIFKAAVESAKNTLKAVFPQI